MMERLTKWKDNRNMLAKPKFSGDFGSANILCKLAEYEDLEELIGIPLKEIAELFRQNIPEDCKNPRKAIVLTDDDVDKWNGYKNAEEQGLLLRLPCKVGGMVFKLKRHNYCPAGSGICHKDISCSECRANTPFGIVEGKFMLKELKEIGKTVFLTQEEAEQKLIKEMERD